MPWTTASTALSTIRPHSFSFVGYTNLPVNPDTCLTDEDIRSYIHCCPVYTRSLPEETGKDFFDLLYKRTLGSLKQTAKQIVDGGREVGAWDRLDWLYWTWEQEKNERYIWEGYPKYGTDRSLKTRDDFCRVPTRMVARFMTLDEFKGQPARGGLMVWPRGSAAAHVSPYSKYYEYPLVYQTVEYTKQLFFYLCDLANECLHIFISDLSPKFRHFTEEEREAFPNKTNYGTKNFIYQFPNYLHVATISLEIDPYMRIREDETLEIKSNQDYEDRVKIFADLLNLADSILRQTEKHSDPVDYVLSSNWEGTDYSKSLQEWYQTNPSTFKRVSMRDDEIVYDVQRAEHDAQRYTAKYYADIRPENRLRPPQMPQGGQVNYVYDHRPPIIRPADDARFRAHRWHVVDGALHGEAGNPDAPQNLVNYHFDEEGVRIDEVENNGD